MRNKKFIFIACLLFVFGIFTQCEKYGGMKGPGLDSDSDDDSDRPAWAGGNTDANTHIKGNDESGSTRGGDYGDLFIIARNENGVPDIISMEIEGETEYFVVPLDVNGDAIPYNDEGELSNPDAVQEVDFGRLNIVRSPQSVLNQAFEESMKVLQGKNAVITLDFCGRLTSTYNDAITNEVIVKTIDSPRENMALYQYTMKNMFEPFEADGVTPNRLAFLKDEFGLDPLMVAASCFAAGSDKTGTVDIDEVVYINGFIDCIGLNPIENDHDYDFNNLNKWYFNFGDCYLDREYKFQYNRDLYKDRYIRHLVWEGMFYEEDDETLADERTESIYNAMLFKFTNQWQFGVEFEEYVKGFAMAVDDAVQVLDYIHGDSNIVFLPGYTPPE